MQIVLLSFFAAKMMSNAWAVKSSPRRANFYEYVTFRFTEEQRTANLRNLRTIPYLFGLALGVATLAVSLAPGILLFGLTPLGRFLTMVESVSQN